VTEVKLDAVDAPDEVKDAFNAVTRAREDKEKLVNEALGYQEDKVPKARGEAQSIMRAAEGYRERRILRSQGDAEKFTAVLAEYQKAKDVTRKRLYLESMERVLSATQRKVVLDEALLKSALPLLPLSDRGGAGSIFDPGSGLSKSSASPTGAPGRTN
jgi:membrane protease subunit HflK